MVLFPSRQLGLIVWVLGRVPSLQDNISQFLGLPQDTGMSQHPCPHAGLCLAQAAGLYSRTWVLECKF